MNFDFDKFLEFPGILVVIGILLIIIAVVIGIIAVAKDKKVEQPEIVEEDDYNVEVLKLVDDPNDEESKEVIAEPVSLIKDNVIPIPIDDETVLVDTEHDELIKPEENDFLDTKEFVILDKVEKTDNTDVETL